jgi:hypothetical protein
MHQAEGWGDGDDVQHGAAGTTWAGYHWTGPVSDHKANPILTDARLILATTRVARRWRPACSRVIARLKTS